MKKAISVSVALFFLLALPICGRAQATGQTTLTVNATKTVHLTWTPSASSGVTGYNVYRADDGSSTFNEINFTLIGGTSYTDATVASGHSYCYVATSVAPTGYGTTESGFSNQLCITMP